MKLQLFSVEMFNAYFREIYVAEYSDIDYFEYIQQIQKLYNEFTDLLFDLRHDSNTKDEDIVNLILKYIDLESLEFWTKTIKIEQPDKKAEAGKETGFVINEILKPNLEHISHLLMVNTAAISNHLEEILFNYRQILKPQKDEGSGKITINGNVQLWGFIFNELISKGYISAPKHNGKASYAKFARQILENFEFTSHPAHKHPTENYLTKALKENKYSLNKQELFKIPDIKNAND